MGFTLAIDTAAPRLQLALTSPGRDAVTLSEEMAKGQAERLFPALAELLAEAGTDYSGLVRIAATTGPGSFTGLRIGLSAARGLGLALGVPVLGIPSLTAISLVATGPALVLLDAKRGEAYVQAFAGPGQPLTPAALRPMVEAEAMAEAGMEVLTSPIADIAAVARFAAEADPADYPPEAAYIRDADAKPQEKFRVARQTA
jgi:tRNA threonylcarbamoyladenosine biosynthesis protein TsaB